MANVAAQIMSWGRMLPAWRTQPAPAGSGPVAGTPILEAQFSNLRLVVEIAWGAISTTDQDSWTWTDVTADVEAAGQVAITVGKADEASTSQPSTCSFRLGNRSGKYSKGPQSPNYPNVVHGVPVRVRAALNSDSKVRFFGFAASFTPSWDVTGKYAVVAVKAAGTLRRLRQGTDPLQSVMRRAIPTVDSLTGYWPCEDGATSKSFAPVVGTLAMQVTGTPSPASFRGFASSLPLPTLGTDSWSANIPAYAYSSSEQIRFLIAFPKAGTLAVGAVIFSAIPASGTIGRVDVVYFGAGALTINSYDNLGTLLTTNSYSFDVDGTLLRMSLSWQPSGADTVLKLSTYTVDAAIAAGVNITVAGHTVAGTRTILFAPTGAMAGVSIGHVYTQSMVDSVLVLSAQVNAFNGEAPYLRINRLCEEQNEPVGVYTPVSLATMGPQLPDTFINLLHACELVDDGILYDGGVDPFNYPFAYYGRELKLNQSAQMILDASSGDVANPIVPVDDDQLTVNQFTSTRINGGSYTYTDTASPLSVTAIGNYSSSASIACETDAEALDYAGWKVHLGTVNDYRYPTMNLVLEEASNVLPTWLTMQLTNRIDVTNISSVRPQQDPKTISVLLEGWTEVIDKFTWHVTMNCSPYDPWRVIEMASNTGDTGAFICHMESDGSSVSSAAPAGSTSLTVATASGPLWTTTADDFPFDVNIADVHVTVTSISGVSSPQTFTVSPTPFQIFVGAAVTAWLPSVLGS